MKEEQIVGHVPFNLSAVISLFLRRDVTKLLLELLEGKCIEGLDMGLKYRVFANFMQQRLIHCIDKL